MRVVEGSAGFTLVEVLIALAITAFISAIAYSSLSSALAAVESIRVTAQRTYELDRAWMIISRDLGQFVARPVRDEFGEVEPAMAGGAAARFPLSFTRTGWHNPVGSPRSNLERVNYRVEDGALWRDSYPVLDRAPDSAPRQVRLLGDVEVLELVFLGALTEVESSGSGIELDTRGWQGSWVADTSAPESELTPPVALEFRLQLGDLGEIRRIYALPPL
ncbi:MAG: type II secretion system minor pseudopilin GspJ [Halieaceae bacterium]|jgi:general secretion pathway protein J|nr:type II secretion system minor pseudopilin GspJ [Halieaceae bacterium]